MSCHEQWTPRLGRIMERYERSWLGGVWKKDADYWTTGGWMEDAFFIRGYSIDACEQGANMSFCYTFNLWLKNSIKSKTMGNEMLAYFTPNLNFRDRTHITALNTAMLRQLILPSLTTVSFRLRITNSLKLYITYTASKDHLYFVRQRSQS